MNFDEIEKSVYGENLEEDAELLAELAAIQEEELGAQRRAASIATKSASTGRNSPGRAQASVPGIDPKLLEAALADAPEDVDDEQLEVDDELLNELAGLVGEEAKEIKQETVSSPTPPPIPSRAPTRAPESITSAPTSALPVPPVADSNNSQVSYLQQLHAVYSKMLASAQQAGEGAKARRYKRAVEKLVELIRTAQRGGKVDEADIPVAPPNFEPVPHPSAPVAQSSQHPPVPSIRNAAATSTHPPIPARRTEAPPIPKRQESQSITPPAPTSMDPKKNEIMRILKHRRDLYVANGKAAIMEHDKVAAKEYVSIAKSFDQAMAALDQASADEIDLNEIPPSPKPYRKSENASSSSSSAPPPVAAPSQVSHQTKPRSFIEGLQQRQQRYLKMAEKAKSEGNDRKTRMNSRLAGQYADAIREAKAGRAVNIDDLPTLPDMEPLPPQTGGQPKSVVQHQRPPSQTGGQPKFVGQHQRPPPQEVGPLAPSGEVGKSRNSAQLEFLIQRQNEFKQCAIHAKSKGNIELARKYLLESKGFEKMIEAAKAGLPVSIKETPIPPQSMTSSLTLEPKIQASTSNSTCLEGRGEKLELLEKTLIEQVKLAETNQMRFTRLGDVGKVKLFESWAKASKQDLLLIRAVAQQNLNLPKFHYELKQIPSADLFPDLAEDVLELTIRSCRDVPLPNGYEPHHANLYVKYIFTLSAENQQTGKTKTITGTVSPDFNEIFMLQIGSGKSRNSKLQRAFKRGGIKFEVYQKGGFMRSDKLLGTCEWKLEQLENTAELEESLPLKDGRKAVGGLASAKVRIREPIGDAKTKSKSHKWLLLDN